jgi:hypothetical protein
MLSCANDDIKRHVFQIFTLISRLFRRFKKPLNAYLDKTASADASLDEGFGDPSGGVGSGSVDFGVVLAGESSTSVGTPTTVGVDDDLATGQTSISLENNIAH